MDMREEFEAWFLANLPNMAAKAISGNSKFIITKEIAFLAWEASRESLVIELPKRWSEQFGSWYRSDNGANLCYYETVKAIEVAGLKTK